MNIIISVSINKEGKVSKRVKVVPERKGVMKKNLGMKEIRNNRNN